MRELCWILYAVGVLGLFYVFARLNYDEQVSAKESLATTQPKETLGYLIGSQVVEDPDSVCGTVTTLKLDTGVEVRACGTFAIIKMGAAVEMVKLDDMHLFCIGEICRREP